MRQGASKIPPTAPNPAVFPPQTVFDYHRTIVGYHGTRRSTASRLVDGEPFGVSENDDDWLGHGVYFWEYAPQPGGGRIVDTEGATPPWSAQASGWAAASISLTRRT